jgi:predicted DNA binding CopG/RHH family protein
MKSKKISRKKESILSEEDFKPENVKVRINMLVSEDLLQTYREAARKLGIGYQTLMQIKLKEAMDHSLEKRIEAIESRLKRA